MKINDNTIKSVICELIGEDSMPLVNVLKTNSNISEFNISSKIKTPVDTIRNQLYRLYNHNLVTFIRKKDKKKGWYIYYWTLNLSRIKYLVNDIKRKRIEALNDRLVRERNSHFFSCQNRCIRVDFEQATNFEYKCPECGELLNQDDNTKNVEEINKEIKKLQEEIATNDSLKEENNNELQKNKKEKIKKK